MVAVALRATDASKSASGETCSRFFVSRLFHATAQRSQRKTGGIEFSDVASVAPLRETIRHPELVEGSVQLQPWLMTYRAHQAMWVCISLSFFPIVDLAWADQSNDDTQAREALWLADHAKLEQKVKTLVIGDVDLKDVTIDQVLDFLRHQSMLVDPDHIGINFVDEVQPEFKWKKFSIKLKNATVSSVLSQFPFTRYSVSDFTVSLRTEIESGLSSRTFEIPDNSLAINPSMLIDKDKLTYDVRPLFKAKGIQFPPGTSAIYSVPQKSMTVVLVNPEDLIRVDELLVYGFKNIK